MPQFALVPRENAIRLKAVTRLRAIVCGATVAVLVLACNALTGVGDLETVDGDGGPVTTSSGDARPFETSTGSSGGTSSGTIDDAGVDSAVADADAGTIDSGSTCGSGHSCVPVTPDGWYGPFQVYSGPSATVPDCPAVMPANDDFATGAATNTAFACECKCGAVGGATCNAFLEEFDGTTCSTQVGEEDLSSCRTPGGKDSSVTVNVKIAGAGSCTPNGALKAKQDPDFPNGVRYCHREEDFTGEGCNANELCVPDGVAPFRTHACIFNLDASVACPAPWTVRVDTFNDVDDSRTCGNGTCNCSPPTLLGCTGTMRNYTASQACAGASTTVTIPLTTCLPVSGGSSQKLVPGSLKLTGSCAPKGEAAPSGGVAGHPAGVGCCIP